MARHPRQRHRRHGQLARRVDGTFDESNIPRRRNFRGIVLIRGSEIGLTADSDKQCGGNQKVENKPGVVGTNPPGSLLQSGPAVTGAPSTAAGRAGSNIKRDLAPATMNPATPAAR